MSLVWGHIWGKGVGGGRFSRTGGRGTNQLRRHSDREADVRSDLMGKCQLMCVLPSYNIILIVGYVMQQAETWDERGGRESWAGGRFWGRECSISGAI